MKNPISPSYAGLKMQARHAADGLAQHAAALNLTHITAALVNGKIEAFDLADANYKRGKTNVVTCKAALETLVDEARAFSFTARDILKPYLGRSSSPAWDEAGFYRSLEVPRLRDLERLVQLQFDLKNYFIAHPTHQNPALNVTSARVEALHTALSSAINAGNTQRAALSALLDVRGAKTADLRMTLRKLLKELSVTLAPTDARWLAFGFNIPGAKQTPEAPMEVRAVQVLPNTLAVDWKPSARAEYYRVRMKIKGVDQEPVVVGKASDPDFTIENVPLNAEAEIAVSAVNNGGESPVSAIGGCDGAADGWPNAVTCGPIKVLPASCRQKGTENCRQDAGSTLNPVAKSIF